MFDHWFIDCARPLFLGQKVMYNYAFVAVDNFSRFPVCIPLKSLTAKNICNALLELWQFTGCGSHVFSDFGTNFISQLTREFLKTFGRNPSF